MAQFISYLESFNHASIVIRLVLATLFGGIIGIERESKRHSAGFRTFTLVCIGSALATIVNLYLFDITGSTDTARISAGVVSGVGFLGVGTIIVTSRNQVRGLTTAATLWATAALGIALGSGMLFASTISFVLIMLTIGVFSYFSKYISKHNRMITLYVEIEKEYDLDLILNFVRDKEYRVLSMEKKKKKIAKNCDLSVTLEVDLQKNRDHDHFINDVGALDGILYVEEINY